MYNVNAKRAHNGKEIAAAMAMPRAADSCPWSADK